MYRGGARTHAPVELEALGVSSAHGGPSAAARSGSLGVARVRGWILEGREEVSGCERGECLQTPGEDAASDAAGSAGTEQQGQHNLILVRTGTE